MSGNAPVAARWWLATLLLGLVLLPFGAMLAQTFPQTSFSAEPAYGAPILAFEFAGSQADLIAVFGPDGDPLQIARLAAMRAGNEQDYVFLLLYGGFLGCGLAALWHELRLRPILAATALPILAALCDACENWLLFDIQAAFTAGDYWPAMASLPYPVAAKFVLLALTNIVIGLALARVGGRWWTLAGTLVIVACVPVLMAIALPSHYGWTLPASVGGGWIVLLGTAAVGCWRHVIGKRSLIAIEAPRHRPPAPSAATAPRRPSFGRRRS